MKKSIGILGGTFDPVHNGHLKLADNAFTQFKLDELWFIPAPNPPHKQNKVITDYKDRMNMLKLAISKFPNYKYSDFETRRNDVSYTYETLTELKTLYPDTLFSFIVGADSLYEIETWRYPEIIMNKARLLVASRDYGESCEDIKTFANKLKYKYGADIGIIMADEVDISSERIRDMVTTGKSFYKYVPNSVADYITSHNLYVGGSMDEQK